MNEIIIKSIYGGIAAIGFGVLFNIPQRTLFYTALIGASGVFCKLMLMTVGIGIIPATLCGASVIGILSLLASYDKNAPALVFSIPAVIPMVPGTYLYRMMVGIIELHSTPGVDFNDIAMQTITNGLNAVFIIMALSVGVSVPNLILRKDAFNELRSMRKPDR